MSRVLVVEDKEENLYYLNALLSGHGWEVELARHGAEALVKARRTPPDLVVSDLLMPVMDGYTLLRHWRLDVRLRHIPFVVYTATYTEPEDERLALQLGADAFILKPAEPVDFVDRLRAVEQFATSRPPTPLATQGESSDLLAAYGSSLIRKLEEKTLQLEEANQTLQSDIAERIRAEAKLREQATLLDKAQDAILVWDLEYRVRYWNRGAERLYGWTAGEVGGRSIAELVQVDAAWFAQASAATLARGEWQGEAEQTTRDARHLTVESRWTLVRDDAGEPRSMLVINTDITERKRLESQFLRAQRMESIGTLSAGIAHDLNNILAPILMSVEVLRSKLPAPADRDTIATLESCCRRGADLVKQVLSFARGIAGQRVEVDPSEVTKELVDVLRETLPRSIAIRFAPPRDLWRVVGDAVQLHQVLLNLCINARDAMPNGGELRVSLENRTLDEASAALIPDGKPGRYVVLAVADQGVGIPHEVRDTIFEPFFTTKDFGKGTGLGLSTTLAIVRSHGGFIALRSEPGAGAEFEVYLPAASGASGAEPTPRDPVGLRLGSGELILLVDDEAAIRDMAKMTLEHCGYRVVTAEDGDQALAIYRASGAGIAAVVTDLAMPGMDGLALSRALRAIDPGVKVLGTSGLELEGGATAAANEGIDIFLMKPYSLDTLLDGIRTLLTKDRAGTE